MDLEELLRCVYRIYVSKSHARKRGRKRVEEKRIVYFLKPSKNNVMILLDLVLSEPVFTSEFVQQCLLRRFRIRDCCWTKPASGPMGFWFLGYIYSSANVECKIQAGDTYLLVSVFP